MQHHILTHANLSYVATYDQTLLHDDPPLKLDLPRPLDQRLLMNLVPRRSLQILLRIIII